MNTKVIAFFAMAVSLAGCSKAVVTMPAKDDRSTNAAAPVPTIQAPAQSQSDRIAEIDRTLSAPLTGSPEDTDRRSALRAERTLSWLQGITRCRPIDPVDKQPTVKAGNQLAG